MNDMNFSKYARESRPEGVGRWIAVGLVTAAVGFGGFGTWAATARLGSAVVAPGVVGVEGNRKTVQHLEGGIVAEITVRDGAVVKAGDVLLRLDSTRTKANVDLLDGQRRALLAQRARLRAEQQGADTIVFPAELEGFEGLRQDQVQLFQSRRRALDGQVQIQRRRMDQNAAEIAAVKAQTKATEARRGLVAVELADVAKLLGKGLERKSRHLELQRELATIDSTLAELQARIAGRERDSIQAELEIANLEDRLQREVADQLQTVEVQLSDLDEQLRAARDVLARTEIRAPQNGVVMGLRVHNVGAVLNPGDTILDLVPSEGALVVEARVGPADIDDVRPGLDAEVRLSAFKARTTPTVNGTVTSVSADRITEPRTGQAYYLATVVLDPQSMPLEVAANLQPGMPADVMISAGERTLVDYLLQPVTDTFATSMREP